MNDDLEPRLTDHLHQRASRVSTPPDVADVHHRIAQHQRRRTRVLGAAIAIALIAGPLVGFAVARSTEPDLDTVTAAGGGGDDSTSGGPSPTFVNEEGIPQAYGGFGLPVGPVSARTTEDGIRLVVHSSDLGQSNGPCVADGIVRVGVMDGDLIDVVLMESAPGAASFLIAGSADQRPMWVVVARGFEDVEATFPNGAVDHTTATDGLAVLAAYADPSLPADALAADTVELAGTPMLDMESTQQARLADGYGGCPPPDAQPPATMPEPGEPPADEAAARAAIEELFSAYGGQDPDTVMDDHERPNVWRDADARFREEHPDYLAWSKEVYGIVHEIVFTAPDRASVRRTLVSDNPDIPTPGERIGEAVLIDGQWKISIESSCSDLALAGIQCDYSIEG